MELLTKEPLKNLVLDTIDDIPIALKCTEENLVIKSPG